MTSNRLVAQPCVQPGLVPRRIDPFVNDWGGRSEDSQEDSQLGHKVDHVASDSLERHIGRSLVILFPRSATFAGRSAGTKRVNTVLRGLALAISTT